MRTRIACIALLALVGCKGGWWGDDDSDGGQSNPTIGAQGSWIGTASTGASLYSLVTDKSDFWAIEVTNTSTALFKGNGNTTNDTFSGSGHRYAAGTASAGTFTSRFTTRQALNGTITSGSVITFNQRYDSGYDTAARLSDITGTWSGADGATFTISSNGQISGNSRQNGDDCDLTGRATANNTKNYYTVTLQYASASSCLHPSKSLSGIAMIVKGNETTQLLVATASDDAQTALASATRK